MLIDSGQTIVFQGDSISDAGRDRGDPASLGYGYAMMASAWFGALLPELKVTFLNRGVGGDRTVDLEKRWKKDCIDLKPDLVSILVGINDTWRRYDRREITPVEAYEKSYRSLLDRVTASAACRLILCEPFVLPFPADRQRWREDLDPKIEVVHKLADEYRATLVPLDRIFKEALAKRDAAYWAPDGVHPSQAGHALIAQSWLKAAGLNANF